MREWTADGIAEEQETLKESCGRQFADVAAAAQKAAVEHGLDARLFDLFAAEFLGADAFKVVAGLGAELTAATREGSFGGTGSGSPVRGDCEYAVQAVTNNNRPHCAKVMGRGQEGGPARE